jgi:hypothetical protein
MRNIRPIIAVVLAMQPFTGNVLAGEFAKPYFTTTTPGAWSEYLLTSPDGSKSRFSYQRLPDENGQIVVSLTVKILEGPGKDTKTENIYVLPKIFDFARDGMSYGKFAEKMMMNFSGMQMVVDATTLETIHQSEKDFRQAVTPRGSQSVDGRDADAYDYKLAIGGPSPTTEEGQLWMTDSVPFGMLRQKAKVFGADGKVASEFDMKIEQSGTDQTMIPQVAIAAPKVEALPSSVGFVEGFQKGRFGFSVEVVDGSSGKKLNLILTNKGDSKLTVNIPSGDIDLSVSDPIGTLLLNFSKSNAVVLDPGATSEPVAAGQRPGRGIQSGRCTLSVYEGTPLFDGSVTKGTIP